MRESSLARGTPTVYAQRSACAGAAVSKVAALLAQLAARESEAGERGLRAGAAGDRAPLAGRCDDVGEEAQRRIVWEVFEAFERVAHVSATGVCGWLRKRASRTSRQCCHPWCGL